MKLAAVVLLFLAAHARTQPSMAVLPLYGQAPANGTATEEIDRSAMQEVCEGGVVNTGADGHLQCAVCPSYTDFQGESQEFRLEAVYRGHFSTADTEQLLLILGGCESHASGFGGSALLTPEGGAWKPWGFLGGDFPRRCVSLRARDGFDRLVCEGEDMHFGTGVAVLYSRSYKGDPQSEPLLNIGGNLGGGTAAGGWCYEQEITSFEKLPSDAGLKVTVTQTRGPVPADEDSCNPDGKIRMEPKQTIILNFMFDGDDFALAPESAAGMTRLRNFVP